MLCTVCSTLITIKCTLDPHKSCNFSEFFRETLSKHVWSSYLYFKFVFIFLTKKWEAAAKKCKVGRLADYIPGETNTGLSLVMWARFEWDHKSVAQCSWWLVSRPVAVSVCPSRRVTAWTACRCSRSSLTSWRITTAAAATTMTAVTTAAAASRRRSTWCGRWSTSFPAASCSCSSR